jgi:hypothetical protein
MAECLAPGPVLADEFHAIYVKDDEAQAQVRELIGRRNRALHVDVMPAMFSSRPCKIPFDAAQTPA